MNLQPGDEDEPEVNLTPLIDVVFLLLIFFMVSTTFEQQSRIQIELPEATATAAETENETLEIVIDTQGRYFIGERQVVNSEVKTLKAPSARQWMAVNHSLSLSAPMPIHLIRRLSRPLMPPASSA